MADSNFSSHNGWAHELARSQSGQGLINSQVSRAMLHKNIVTKTGVQ